VIAHFDWQKAQICLARALEIDPSDGAVKGKLALVRAYLVLLQESPDAGEAKAGFEEAAALSPRSPDPHLGLARVYIYLLHNVGGAVAEFHQAERLGCKIGPREMAQQADGYLARAQSELQQAESVSKTSPVEEARQLSLARRDFERANNLYEPIDGFSDVNLNLQNLYKGRTREEHLQQAYEMARVKRPRTRRWR
jgi:tetratricopeptide (TPR) repeat protein